MSKKLKAISQFENVTILARFDDSMQPLSDYLVEHSPPKNGLPEKKMCLMPNCHYVYMEYMFNNKSSQKVGTQVIIDCSKGTEIAVKEYVDSFIIPRIKSKMNYYNQRFPKK